MVSDNDEAMADSGRPRYEAYNEKAKEESAKLVDCDLLRISPTDTYHPFLCNI